MNKLKICVIGTGRMGNFHSQKVKANPNALLTGIYDPDPEVSSKVAESLDVRSFADINSALAENDAVILAAPTQTHAEIGLKIINEGKHLLVEKPIASQSDGARLLVEAAEKKNVVLAVGHIENFNPAFQASLPFINDPIFVESHRLSPFVGRGIDVSVVMDLMIHDIEMLVRLMGDVISIEASGASILTPNIDIASARLTFEHGVANVTASRISDKPLRKMRFFNYGGYASIDFGAKTSEVILSKKFPDIPENSLKMSIGGEDFYSFKPQIKEIDPLYEQLDDFIFSINNREHKPFVSGKSGLAALEVAEKILKKMG